MVPAARLKTWTPRLLFLSVLAVLLLVGVIQYQWFSRSAAVEIEGAIRGLEASVRQTALRELQRYAPLMSEAQALATDSDHPTPLDRLLQTYGPTGVTPDLLAWAGVAKAGQQTWTQVFPDGRRLQVRIEGEPWPGVGPGEGPPEALLFGEAGQRTQTIFLRRTDRDELLLLGVDQKRFWDAYVAPSLIETFPGAQVRLLQPEGDGPRLGFDGRQYTFNPLIALLGQTSIPRDIVVGLPRLLDPLGRSSRVRGTSEVFQSLGPVPGFSQIVVTLPSNAPVLEIERRLAWNWLGSTLLLLVLAGTFGLVLRQSGRLADLRRREREFVASVSHELRTPLTVIRSAADNFAQGIVAPERQTRYGQLILDQSLRLGRMIEEMLSFAQAEASTPTALVQAPLVFESWLAELRPPLEALAAARQVQLHWDVSGVPPSGLSDPDSLRHILENLVINAINHAYPAAGTDVPARPVRITLRYLVPDRLELSVDDDGRGISPQEAKKVFEPFYRDQVSRDQQEKGSGLGLFLARHQARRLGGDLKLETPWRRPDGTRRSGCRFTVVVPFVSEVNHGR